MVAIRCVPWGALVMVAAAVACGADAASPRTGGHGPAGSREPTTAPGSGQPTTADAEDFGNNDALREPAMQDGGSGTAGGAAGTMDTPAEADAGTGVCGAASGAQPAAKDACGNGLDDDHNGFVDELCSCTAGETQECFGGRPDLVELDICTRGTQRCVGDSEFAAWGRCEGWSCGSPVEVCETGEDEDCDGQVDEGCTLQVPVDIDGDCVTVACPAQAAFPIGCSIDMQGDDPRGCVANTPGQSGVYFQEGNQCGAGRVVGSLLCSTQMPTAPLDPSRCAINKPDPTFGLSSDDCAPTNEDEGGGCIGIPPFCL